MNSQKKFLFLFFIFLFWGGSLSAAPKADLWPYWQTHDPDGKIQVDQKIWGDLLKKYLKTDHPSGINRFRYQSVHNGDKKKLQHYLNMLQMIEVSKLNRKEQKAFWINFYNSLTVKVILDHYPVASIRDIDISPGFFNDGPWDKKLVTVENRRLSLNDIEHRILRPIWQDNRVHYALNCASIGCPNLQAHPFTATNTESLLDKGAREYINHQRGVRPDNGTLVLSSIYKWFRNDFGGSEQGVLQHLIKYAEQPLAENLQRFKGSIKYDYDWSLNE